MRKPSLLYRMVCNPALITTIFLMFFSAPVEPPSAPGASSEVIAKMDELLREYRRAVVRELEIVINPDVYLLVEKGCNFGIFDEILGDQKTLMLKKVNGRFSPVEPKETDENTLCVIFSNYLRPVEGMRSFYYTYEPEARFGGDIELVFSTAFRYLRDTKLSELNYDIVKYTAKMHPEYTLYTFELTGSGRYLVTAFKAENEIMNALFDMRRELLEMSKNLPTSTRLLDTATNLLVDMLRKHKIMVKEVDFAALPEIAMTIFPFKMMEVKSDRAQRQLITIGVDLRQAGRFGDCFDLSKHSLEYYVSFPVYYPAMR